MPAVAVYMAVGAVMREAGQSIMFMNHCFCAVLHCTGLMVIMPIIKGMSGVVCTFMLVYICHMAVFICA